MPHGTTTISVRLDDRDLAKLDALKDALYERKKDATRYGWTDKVTRADAIRHAIDDALKRIA